MSRHSAADGATLHMPYRVHESDPGAIGAHKVWLDPATGVVRRRNADNDGWIVEHRPAGVQTEATDEYTLADGDEGQHIRVSHATGADVVVPEDATHEFAVGTRIRIEQAGEGPVTVIPEASDPTILSRDGRDTTFGQYAVVELVKVDADEWVLTGDLAEPES